MDTQGIKTALAAMIALFPVTITKGETDYTVMRHSETADRAYLPEGEQSRYSCTFSALYDDTSDLETDDKITCGTKEYRIRNIVDDTALVRRKLVCEEA